jgi:hypothetical protein
MACSPRLKRAGCRRIAWWMKRAELLSAKSPLDVLKRAAATGVRNTHPL